ncbi:hypothetical protein [Caminibacter mediatlanticus]|uniref:30S ribosomal protein S7 n=1 Tax=Caminibacter mediatlanticus TB-2 TaxID=391592 RepID=A0AAI9AGD6_9BACT|nr:hypothetical protein [Caminibacter mediatlanticus]EDM23143.1 30S ribosomal protein S7 [Caminibacter mediatlanticus TB-2]
MIRNIEIMEFLNIFKITDLVGIGIKNLKIKYFKATISFRKKTIYQVEL